MSKHLAASLLFVVSGLIAGSQSASLQIPEASPSAPAAVTITYPANGAQITVPTNIFVSADVTAPVSRVDFFSNNSLIGTDSSAPYFIVWNNPAVTTYNLTAVAVDAVGNTTTSGSVSITTSFPGSLYPLPIPGPTLLSPPHGAIYNSLTPITLSSTRSQTQYTVGRVEFYANTTLVGSDTTDPYSIVWTNPPPGVHSITARTVVTTGARASSTPADIRIIPSNAAPITLNDLSTASPYPSSIEISGLSGAVSHLTLTIEGFSHTSADDIDLLLVAPNGRSILLMSDVGGTVPASNLSLTFDTAAFTPLPDEGPLVSGSFRPTNIGGGDTFPAPAPVNVPTFNNLSDFNGSNPNGTWSLYAVDDEGGNAGSIGGGWGLTINTSTTICGFNISPATQVFPHTGGNGVVSLSASFPSCDWTAGSNSSFINITSATSGTGPASVDFVVAPNMGGARTGSLTIAGRTLTIQQASGCPFALSQETFELGASGGSRSVAVTASGICGWEALTKDSWITINMGTGSGNGTVNFSVAPNSTGSPRTGTIDIGARTLTINQSAVNGRSQFDFDGDGRADIAVFRPQEGHWYILLSSNSTFRAEPFGVATDRPVPGDYDGDGKTDIAVWRPADGVWHILQSTNNNYVPRQFGANGDLPVAGDYDGDGKTDLTVYRPSAGVWYILKSLDGTLRAEQFGSAEDKPLKGDFDGDGRSDLAVFRSSNGTWYVLRSSDNSFFAQQFGTGTDRPVAGDYDGDSKTDVAVYRPAVGTWYISQSTNNALRAQQFGASGDIPVAADYDGDGKWDLAVFRPAGGIWYILQSSNNAVHAEQFGVNADVPVPSAYVP